MTAEDQARHIAELEAAIKNQGSSTTKGEGETDGAQGASAKRNYKAVNKADIKLKKAVKEKRKRKDDMNDDTKKEVAEKLIIMMNKAVNDDNEANQLKRPALQKLLNLDHAIKELRRIPIQEFFLDSNGCNSLAGWIYPLPDGTYPNVRVVQEIL